MRSARKLPREIRIQTLVALGVLAVLIVGLAGCTSEPRRAPAEPAYVGVFTGEFVDGKPLYRFPTIEVIGSRSTIGPGT